MAIVSAFSVKSAKGSAFSAASKEVKTLEEKVVKIFSAADKEKLLADFAESKRGLIAKKLELDELRVIFETNPLQKNFDALRVCGDQYKEFEKTSYQVFCIAFDAGCFPELYDPTESPVITIQGAKADAAASAFAASGMNDLD